MTRARHSLLGRSHLHTPAVRWLLGVALLSACSDRTPVASIDDTPYAAHPKSPSQAQLLVAEHRPMHLSTTFAAGRVSVRAPSDDASDVPAFELGAVAWGCADAMQPIPSVAPAASASAVHPGGVEYRHQDFDEWYVMGPLGLEQGFTIRHLPECAARGAPLTIELAFQAADGFSSGPSDVPNEAWLQGPGNRRLHYGQAHAEDARGGEFAVNIETRATLRLELDASRAVLPLLVDPLAWAEQTKLTATDSGVGDAFGAAVAVSADTALIGAPANGGLATASGSAYVFVRAGNLWLLQQKLQAKDGTAFDAFGTAVALNGDTAIIGAPGDDDSAVDSGSAYVFVRTNGVWTQTKKLTGSDPAAGNRFGSAISMSASVAVIGAPFADTATPDSGVAYTYLGPTWTQQAKIAPAGAANDHNGAGVAISGDRLALGSDRALGNALFFYRFVNGAWQNAGTANSTNPALSHYGSALAMSTNYTVVGARSGVSSSSPSGLALVFSNANIATQYTLSPSDLAAGDLFGSAVAISSNDTILVASPKDDDKGVDSGSVYVFSFGAAWVQQQKLTASDGVAADGYGSALALSGTAALIGAPSFGDKTGAAYVEGYLATNGTACAQNSECGSGFCVENVCCNSACTGACQSCLQANKVNGGGANGSCGNVRVGFDPHDSCTMDVSNPCSNAGFCDGKGACALSLAGTSCTLSACASLTSGILNSACDGLGDCKPVATVPCQLGYQCVNAVCKSGCSANSDCDQALGYACTPTGECKKPKGTACSADSDCSTGTCQYGSCCLANADGVCSKPLGTECALGSECSSGQCENGVCCGSACTGQCQSCALPASKGICSAISDPPCSSGTGGSAGAPGQAGQAGDAGLAQGGFAGNLGFGGTAGVSSGFGGSVGLAGSVGFAGNLGFAGSTGFAGNAAAGALGLGGSAGFGPGGPTGNAGTGARAGLELAGTSAGGQTGDSGSAGKAGASAFPRAGGPGDPLQDEQWAKACGCRLAGSRGATQSACAVFVALLLAGLRRRSRRAQPTRR